MAFGSRSQISAHVGGHVNAVMHRTWLFLQRLIRLSLGTDDADTSICTASGVTARKFNNLAQKLVEHAHRYRLTDLDFKCVTFLFVLTERHLPLGSSILLWSGIAHQHSVWINLPLQSASLIDTHMGFLVAKCVQDRLKQASCAQLVGLLHGHDVSHLSCAIAGASGFLGGRMRRCMPRMWFWR